MSAKATQTFNADVSQFHILLHFGRGDFEVADFIGDRAQLIRDIGSLQIACVYRITEFNEAESFARDVTVEIAKAALDWREDHGREWNEELADLAQFNRAHVALIAAE